MSSGPAKEGDKVSVVYTGKLKDGTVFDSNRGQDLFEFEVGSGQVIAGFDKAVSGLGIGESRTVELPPDDAYGERDDELVIPVGTDIFGDQKPQQGMEVALRGRDGAVFNGRVVKIEDEAAHVDLNHPLAGETLVFEIELVGIDA